MNSHKYKELLRSYKKRYGSNGEKVLRIHINNIRRELLVDEKTALEILYYRLEKIHVKSEKVIELSPQLKLSIKYEGKKFIILYLPIIEFVEDLNLLGKTLEYLEENVGKVISIIGKKGLLQWVFMEWKVSL
ncbi:MAG: hypothetical protein DRN61_06195 [Thaumarchaeota archaeon]|nr:MAG: hypothetical protein DRN61_06195 [Nitrososphaerota archaeon]